MAELSLEQVLSLIEALESDNYQLALDLVDKDVYIDDLEKENDNLSQNAILEAVASRETLRKNKRDGDLKGDPLRFALSAIRITPYFERIGDQVVSCAKTFSNGNIRKGIFLADEDLALILSRVITIVGMSVESLVEEKDRFFGNVQKVEDELDRHCTNFFHKLVNDDSFSREEFADIYRILLALERLGDLATNISMELVRLVTGQDIRHLFPSLAGQVISQG